MSAKHLLFASVLFACVLTSTQASYGGGVNYLGRWIGMGWSNGYHAYRGCGYGSYDDYETGAWAAPAAPYSQAPLQHFGPANGPQPVPAQPRLTPSQLPAPTPQSQGDRAARFPGYYPGPNGYPW